MKNKMLSIAMFIIFLSVALPLTPISFAQKSIFENDTISFQYYKLDDQNKILPLTFYAEELDTFINHTITIDGKKNVHWNVMNFALSAEVFALNLWNLGLHNINEDVHALSVEITKKRISNLPAFRVIRGKKKFQYETIGPDRKVFFAASLSSLDTLDKLPFFMNEAHAEQMGIDDLNLVYTGDTIVLIKNKEVPCHKLTSQTVYVPDGMQKFSLRFFEIYFESASLLPVFTLERYCYRTEYTKENRIDSAYRINFLTRIISIK